MKRLPFGCCVFAALGAAQSLEVTLPTGVRSEGAFVHFAVDGDETGGWVQPPAGVSSFRLDTSGAGGAAARVRAILHVPGCRLQTLDLPVAESQYSFECRPLGTIAIPGALTRSDRLYGRQVTLEARYVARWARSFLGLRAPLVDAIPIGDVVDLPPDGRFRLTVPDLSQYPLARDGEFQIWARDKATRRLVDQVTPLSPASVRARMGGLRIERAYRSEIVFAPCAATATQPHDAEGFALRPDLFDGCDR
jgi:hypothetical protein